MKEEICMEFAKSLYSKIASINFKKDPLTKLGIRNKYLGIIKGILIKKYKQTPEVAYDNAFKMIDEIIHGVSDKEKIIDFLYRDYYLELDDNTINTMLLFRGNIPEAYKDTFNIWRKKQKF